MTTITRRTALAGLSAMAVAPGMAQAQSGRPITMIHGFTPGANVDITTRLVSEYLSKRLGQPIVVETRAGAGGRERSPGPGAGSPWWRSSAAYARNASVPVTFCSRTDGSSAWNTRRVCGRRSPGFSRWRRRSATGTGHEWW